MNRSDFAPLGLGVGLRRPHYTYIRPAQHWLSETTATIVQRFEPAWLPDHLCWTSVHGRNLHDTMSALLGSFLGGFLHPSDQFGIDLGLSGTGLSRRGCSPYADWTCLNWSCQHRSDQRRCRNHRKSFHCLHLSVSMRLLK
jgi:hypothetical protein